MAFEDAPPDVPPSEDPIEPVTDTGSLAVSAEDRQWGMFAHLSALVGWFIGFPILGPLIVWLMKKDQSKFVDYHGKESLNFQINILIYTIVSGVVTLATCGITIPLLLIVVVWSIVMPILAGLAANKGEEYRYPLTFRIIK
jgi:uncharacterized Tic20 family protein